MKTSCPIHAPAMCASGHPCPDTRAALREIATWPAGRASTWKGTTRVANARDQVKLRATRRRWNERQKAKRAAESAS